MTTKQRIAVSGGLFLIGGAVMAQDAKEVYLEKCSICHGADGAGKTAKGRKTKVKDVRETAPKVSAAEMQKIVENGKGDAMDAYGKELGKDVIKAVVDYYRSLAK